MLYLAQQFLLPATSWHICQLCVDPAPSPAALLCDCCSRSGSASRGQVLLGGDPPDRVHFLENGLAFAADVVQGQKTGFFLDQRDNRQRLAVREGEGGGAERRYPVVKS